MSTDDHKFLVKRLDPEAKLPKRETTGSAGLDISSIEDVEIAPGESAAISTGLAMRAPLGTFVQFAPRSGHAFNKDIALLGGIIDRDFTGPTKVKLFNHGKEPFRIEKGMRIAQIILQMISMADAEEVAELPETTRGAGGFGSTGVR